MFLLLIRNFESINFLWKLLSGPYQQDTVRIMVPEHTKNIVGEGDVSEDGPDHDYN